MAASHLVERSPDLFLNKDSQVTRNNTHVVDICEYYYVAMYCMHIITMASVT